MKTVFFLYIKKKSNAGLLMINLVVKYNMRRHRNKTKAKNTKEASSLSVTADLEICVK